MTALLALLFIAFLAMKLCGIAISWWVVFAPVIVWIVGFVLILFTIGASLSFWSNFDPREKRRD